MYEEYFRVKNLIGPVFDAVKTLSPDGAGNTKIYDEVIELMNVPEDCVEIPLNDTYPKQSKFKYKCGWAKYYLRIYPADGDGYILHDEKKRTYRVNPKYDSLSGKDLPIDEIYKHKMKNKGNSWVAFYHEFAEKILSYKDNRGELLKKIDSVCSSSGVIFYLGGSFGSNYKTTSSKLISEIDPFTIFGYLNSSNYDDTTRTKMCASFKAEFELKTAVPSSFEGIPLFGRTQYKAFEWQGHSNYDKLTELSWQLFELCFKYDGNGDVSTIMDIIDDISHSDGWGVGLISKVLFCINPSEFFVNDNDTCQFIIDTFSLLGYSVGFGNFLAKDYFEIINLLKGIFASDDGDTNVKSFIDLNYAMYQQKNSDSYDEESSDEDDTDIEAYHKIIGANLIYYGIPGSGKSYLINDTYHITEKSENGQVERIVFHPDYSYSDFVGQLLPKTQENGDVKYEFEPGPFTRILKKAENDDSNEYYLLIEEVNRGNAPAIFGDIFQLLDRDQEGNSIFPIINKDIAKEVYGAGKEETPIIIPNNLFIICTMNTADQNVFTLDTAFKRRWKMKYIQDEFKDGNNLKDLEIGDTGITWQAFHDVINEAIASSNRFLTSEDKRLGVYFCSKGEIEDIDQFTDKVIRYLWDDVSKVNREIFRSDITSFDTIYAAKAEDSKNFFHQIFSENIIDSLENYGQ